MEENHAISMAKVDAHFRTKKKPKEPPIDEATKKYFKSLVFKKVVKEPILDYDRSITKAFEKKKRSQSTIPQLREQSQQSIDLLKVLSEEDEILAQWIAETNLTKEQLLGGDNIETHPGIGK